MSVIKAGKQVSHSNGMVSVESMVIEAARIIHEAREAMTKTFGYNPAETELKAVAAGFIELFYATVVGFGPSHEASFIVATAPGSLTMSEEALLADRDAVLAAMATYDSDPTGN